MAKRSGIYYVNATGVEIYMPTIIVFENAGNNSYQLQEKHREILVKVGDTELIKDKGEIVGVCPHCKELVYSSEDNTRKYVLRLDPLHKYTIDGQGFLYQHLSCKLDFLKKQAVSEKALRAARRARRWKRYRQWFFSTFKFMDGV